MPRYETGDFVPPAPVARGVVRGPAGATRSGVALLVDTGADVSVVPRRVAEDVGAAVQPSGVAIRSYDGSEVVCDLAELSVVPFSRDLTGPAGLGVAARLEEVPAYSITSVA
jgi:hypothetical protein